MEVVGATDTDEPRGTVDVGKRLRPNYRHRQVVLYITRHNAAIWEAVRLA